MKLVNETKQFCLRHAFAQRVLYRVKTAGFRASLLVANVNLARRVLSDDYDGESRSDAVFAHEGSSLLPDRLGQLLCLGFSIDAFSRHFDFFHGMVRARRMVTPP